MGQGQGPWAGAEKQSGEADASSSLNNNNKLLIFFILQMLFYFLFSSIFQVQLSIDEDLEEVDEQFEEVDEQFQHTCVSGCSIKLL